MRILHLDSGGSMRGGQWQVLRLLEGLSAEGVPFTLLAPKFSPLWAAARERGWPVSPLSLVRILSLSRSHDLIHAHDARSHTLALLSTRPLIVSRRVAFPIRARWKYRRSARIIGVSEFVKSVLARGGVPADKVAVVYDGVPLLDCPPGDLVMASASFDPGKGVALAQHAAALAGAELHLSHDLASDLRRGAIFLYLTKSEGLGSGALLAMSAGAAVIASNVGGLPEAIRHRENGILVENRPEAVAEAMRELRGNPALRQQLGEAARQTVKERFTIDRMVRRTMEIYRQVLG